LIGRIELDEKICNELRNFSQLPLLVRIKIERSMLSPTFNEGIFKKVFCGRSVRRVLVETLFDEVLAVVAYFIPRISIEIDIVVDN
jgi:hypothetical protein